MKRGRPVDSQQQTGLATWRLHAAARRIRSRGMGGPVSRQGWPDVLAQPAPSGHKLARTGCLCGSGRDGGVFPFTNGDELGRSLLRDHAVRFFARATSYNHSSQRFSRWLREKLTLMERLRE